MTDTEKIEELKQLLSKAGQWFNDNKSDQDYIYDMSYEQFSDLSRSICAEILTILFE